MKPIPYNKYDQAEIREMLDSLPLAATGKRICVGQTVSFIVRMEHHTRTRSIITGLVVGVTQDRVFFDTGLSKLNDVNDGIKAERCYHEIADAQAEYEKGLK